MIYQEDGKPLMCEFQLTSFKFALYVFAMNYHDGQSSRLYSILSRLKVSLRDNHIDAIIEGTSSDWAVEHDYYLRLVGKYA